MSYEVFLVSSAGALRDHHVIFVQTNPDKSGSIHQVTGNISQGMKYDPKHGNPEESASFIKKELIGTVSTTKYWKFDTICSNIPPPAKQFRGAKQIDPEAPLRRCQEWTIECIKTLKDESILD